MIVYNTYQWTLVGCKVRECQSTRFGPESGRNAKDGIQTQRARKACASKPNHRCQLFTKNHSSVSLISREIYFLHETVLSSFRLSKAWAEICKELNGCGIWSKHSLHPIREFLGKEISSPVWVRRLVVWLRIIWKWDLEYLSWSRWKERVVPFKPGSSSCKL